MSERHIIYGLFDPITNILHYIGYTSNEEKRYNEHCYRKSGTKEKRIWIARLKKQKLKPIMEVIEEYSTAEELPPAEEFWYGYFTLIGAELYNDPYWIGSGSRKGKAHTEETKAKMREKRKGQTPFKGKKHSPTTKQKIGDASRGKTPTRIYNKTTNETKSKISKALKGRKSERNGKTWKVIKGKTIWLEKPSVPEGTQQCVACGEIKILEDFSFTNSMHAKRNGVCKSCRNKRSVYRIRFLSKSYSQ